MFFELINKIKYQLPYNLKFCQIIESGRPNLDNHIQHNKGRKIKIHFLYIIDSYWMSWASFYNACINDPRVETEVILLDTSKYNHTLVRQHISQLKNQKKFLKQNAIPFRVYDQYFPEKELPDVIVYSSPYNAYYRELFKRVSSDSITKLGIKTVYIPYGIEYDKDGEGDYFLSMIQTGQDVHFNAWRIYVMHQDIKNYFKSRSYVNYNHVKVFGAPKFDQYFQTKGLELDPEILKRANGRKIIMYQIHLLNNNNLNYLQKILNRYHTMDFDFHLSAVEIMKQFQNYYFVITFHPLFESTAVEKFKLITQELFDYYIQEINNCENCCIYSDPNYQALLMNADAFITENSSLMLEMAFFEKPVLYLYDVPVTMKNFAKEIISTFYHGHNKRDLIRFLSYDLEHFDLLDERLRMKKSIYKHCDGKIGIKILEDILSAI